MSANLCSLFSSRCGLPVGYESFIATVDAVLTRRWDDRTIQSMLASNTKLELPTDNDRYVANAPSNPKHTKWAFHDDVSLYLLLTASLRKLRIVPLFSQTV